MGRIRIEQMTDRDVRRFKKDIEGYERTKRLFLIMAFVALGLMLFLLCLAIVFGVFAGIAGSDMNDFFSYEYFGMYLTLCITSASFASTAFVYMLLMFILRSVLFKKKIENRQFAIEEYEIYQKEHSNDPKQVEVIEEK